VPAETWGGCKMAAPFFCPNKNLNPENADDSLTTSRQTRQLKTLAIGAS